MNRNLFLKQWRDILLLPFNVTVIIPYLLNRIKFPLFNESFFLPVIGVFLFIAGMIIFIWTIILFHTLGKGTLAPWSATNKLVISGPYRHLRNPMISGVFCILLAETLFLNSLPILIWSFVFFAINNFYFIFKEEPDLKKRFGSSYEIYKKQVPRWLPRIRPYRENENTKNIK